MSASSPFLETSNHISTLLISFILIIAIIATIAWLMHHARNRFIHKDALGIIRIAAQMPLGLKERIAIVEAGGAWMLLGITAENIVLLHHYPEKPLQADHDTVTPFRKIMRHINKETTS